MSPTAPAWKPQINRIETPDPNPFWQRPAVHATLRALYVVAGLGVAAVAFVFIGMYAALLGCVGEETRGLCASAAWLVPVLEWPIFLTAWMAPLFGGLTSYVRRDPFWLCAGALSAVVMGFLLAAVSAGQTGLLS